MEKKRISECEEQVMSIVWKCDEALTMQDLMEKSDFWTSVEAADGINFPFQVASERLPANGAQGKTCILLFGGKRRAVPKRPAAGCCQYAVWRKCRCSKKRFRITEAEAVKPPLFGKNNLKKPYICGILMFQRHFQSLAQQQRNFIALS